MGRLRVYHCHAYNIDGVDRDCIVSYMPENGIYLTSNIRTVKILQRMTGEDETIDESNIDSYMESRGFDKMVELEGTEIDWYNNHGSDMDRDYLHVKIPMATKFLKKYEMNNISATKPLPLIYVYLTRLNNII